MWKYKIDEEHLRGFLLSGKLDEEMDHVFENFWDFSHQFQFELIKYVKARKVFPSLSVIKKVFKVKEETAKALIEGSFKEFSFPAVEDEKAQLINGLVVPNLPEVITNVEGVKRYLKPIREFLGFGFGVFFDIGFSGRSFQLPLTLSLCLNSMPSNLLFTGAIDREGRVKEVDGIPKKRELAKKLGLYLVEPSKLRTVQEIKAWYESSIYHVPFYITKSKDKHEGEWESFLSSVKIENVKEVLRNLENLNCIEKEKLLFITGQLNRNWGEVFSEIYSKLKELETALRGKEKLHIAINGPSALAFGVGILLGSQKPFVFYHMQNGIYHPIEVNDVRYLKERVKEPKEIEYKLQEGNSKLVVILSLSHHELEEDVRKFVSSFLENPSFLIIRHSRAGNILVENMKEVSKEIAGLIQEIRKERSFDEFHFFFSCPVPIAFMVGVAFGHYSQGVVYNYQGEENIYVPVFELAFLRSLREGAYAETNL
ncbi:SAVED domain-containing protein [Thermocrinis sp.]